MTENIKSCAVAFPSKRNAQLSPLECATDSATPAQPNSLKAASLRILERNKARNTCATETEKTAQLWGEKTGLKVARVAQAETDETRIRAWLAHIGEIDSVMIEETLQRCATDPEALRYFLWRAQEVPAHNQPEKEHKNDRPRN